MMPSWLRRELDADPVLHVLYIVTLLSATFLLVCVEIKLVELLFRI